MSVTLGVHIGHDAAAALFAHGRLRYAEEEERHSGRKAHSGCPWQAIDAALASVSARDRDVKTVALTWELERYLACRRDLAEHARGVGNEAWYDKRQREVAAVEEAVAALRERFPQAEVVDFPHHLCHLACAVHFDQPRHSFPVVGIVADALGDAESLTAFAAPDALHLLTEPAVVHQASPHDSLGFFYKRAAEAFGFAGREACGYLMALSGCCQGGGEAALLREQLFASAEGGVPSFRPGGFDPFRGHGDTARRCFSPELVQALSLEDPEADLLARAPSARAVQALAEDYLLGALRQLVIDHDPELVYLSGGVFLNCVALEKLADAFPQLDLVVCPVKKDSGTAIGAAFLAEIGRNQRAFHMECDRTLRLGTPISGQEPDWDREDLAGAYLVFGSPGALVSSLADEVTAGKLVALVDGPGEFGPRALGARSLLATPSSADLARHLNEQVKRRYPFQPFAGAFLQEDFRRARPLKTADVFMSTAVQLEAEDREALAGIVHRDGSSRVQLVPAWEHSLLRKLLVELKSRGERGVVLNTSLNAKGEPMPRTAADVLRTCAQLGVEAIYTPTGRRSLAQ